MIKDFENSVKDLILFAGQSNMAGRGDAGEAVACEAHMGREFRAISDPSTLYPIQEPFGIKENNREGMDDGRKKTGSLVSAFVRKYYGLTGHAVIAVSASKGGSSSADWLKLYAADAALRLRRARAYLEENGVEIAHACVLWSQGETDGDKGLDAVQYFKSFQAIWEILREAGAEKCFLIQTGHYNYVKYPGGAKGITGAGLDRQYEVIRRTQEKMCTDIRGGGARLQERKPVACGMGVAGQASAADGTECPDGVDMAAQPSAAAVSCLPEVYMAASFEPYLGMMKDQFHYRQQAYNEVGETAAENMTVRLLGEEGIRHAGGIS